MKKIKRIELRNAHIFLWVMIGIFLFAQSINAQTSKSNLLFERCADNMVLLDGYNADDVLDSVLCVPSYVRLGAEVLQVKGIADNAFRVRSSLQRVTYSNDTLVIDNSNLIVAEGLGTYDAPYTIAGAQAHQSEKGYVKGYIVGFISGQKLTDAVFGTDGAVASNIIIATSADETDISKCLPIQLVGGSAVRTGINLMDNAGMYKKELLIYGSLEKYFGAAGLQSTTYAECDGKTFGTKPGDDPQPTGEGYYMDFKATGSQDDWTIEDKTLPEGLTYVWGFDSRYGMKASAYISKCLAAESWLISPAINMPSGVSTLTIHEAMNLLKGGNRADHVNVMVSTDKTNWSVVNMTGWPTGTDWNFGDYTADFSTYAGKTIYIAFKYTSTDSCAPTWEIEKLSICDNNQKPNEKLLDNNATNSLSFEIGNNAFSSCTNITRIDLIPNTTTIGANAFLDCKSLRSITLPNSVTSIGEGAFYGCTSLPVENNLRYADTYLIGAVDKTLYAYTIKEGTKWIGDSAFENCTGLISIEIPNSVTSIGSSAFDGCSNVKELIYAEGTKTVLRTWLTSITSVTIPNSVTSIGDYAFRNCSGLTSVTIPNSVTNIANSAFEGCSSLLEVTLNTDAIVNKTYAYFSSLKNIFGAQVLKYIIGNEVKGIGNYAFSGCTSLPVENNLRYADTYLVEAVDKTLSTYTIKDGTKWIGSDAFYNCTGLTSIEIPNSVTSIGERAFYGCTKLSNVKIGNSVVSIGDYAFYGCSDLESIVLPDVLKEIGYYAFANTCLTSIAIPNSVTSIGYGVFENCKVLSSVKIGKSVERIGEYAFHGCLCMDSIDIPHGVIAIGYNAFYGCQSLKKVKIPSSVQEIDSYAFYKCPNLEDVYVCWNKPITIGSTVFDKTNGYILSTLWVPIGRMNFYKVVDQWSKFVEIKEWDASTEIEEIKIDATDEASPKSSPEGKDLYNLQGQKVSVNGFRGVVIKNGKKYVVK